jgi:fermentation-respiration switch protein FrsA (DUF1100 family)
MHWNPSEKKTFEVKGIQGWYFENNPSAKTILHCHGNYGNISYLRNIVKLAREQGLNLIVYDYHGYGKSKGSPSPKTILDDGEIVYQYAVKTLGISPDNLIIWGESLGGAVATHIASKFPCSILVLVATFSSLDDLIKDTYPNIFVKGLTNLIGVFLPTLPSKEKISRVNAPVVIIHSKEDELIPYNNAKRMYESISHECKKFITVNGYHASPKLTKEVLEEILAFCCTDISRCHCVDDLLKNIGTGEPHCTIFNIGRI